MPAAPWTCQEGQHYMAPLEVMQQSPMAPLWFHFISGQYNGAVFLSGPGSSGNARNINIS